VPRSVSASPGPESEEYDGAVGVPGAMLFILWLIAVVLVVAGIFQLFKGEMLWGIVLIIVGFAVGPGGYSIFS
jgi:hypothetical protein